MKSRIRPHAVTFDGWKTSISLETHFGAVCKQSPADKEPRRQNSCSRLRAENIRAIFPAPSASSCSTTFIGTTTIKNVLPADSRILE